MAKRSTTKADLNAANAEAKDLMNQVRLLRDEKDQAQAQAQRERDDFVLDAYCKAVSSAAEFMPPNIFFSAGCSTQDGKLVMFNTSIGSLLEVAAAIKRRRRMGGCRGR